jgi:hypothetical protein
MVAVMAGRLLRASVISAHQRGSEDGRDTHIARRSMTVAQRSESAAVGIRLKRQPADQLDPSHVRARHGQYDVSVSTGNLKLLLIALSSLQ